MKEVLTMEILNEAVKLMREEALKPITVKSHWQAFKMTWNYPFGSRWRKGDKYYFIMINNKDAGLKI